MQSVRNPFSDDQIVTSNFIDRRTTEFFVKEPKPAEGAGMILGIAAFDFAGDGAWEVDFLAKSNEGFRRIGNVIPCLEAERAGN
jgi:hypothetical protein